MFITSAFADDENCFEEDIVYAGEPVDGIDNKYIANITSAKDCQKECQNNDACKFWTWNSPNFKRNKNTCWLKAGKGTERTKAGKISGRKTCGKTFIGFQFPNTIVTVITVEV